MMDRIPVIDLLPWLHGGADERGIKAIEVV